MMDEFNPGLGMSGCLNGARLTRDVAERMDCVSDVPAMLASDASAATADCFEVDADNAGLEPGKGFSDELSANGADGT